jgi:L-2-hydroxyglutarate oxidase LhgO
MTGSNFVVHVGVTYTSKELKAELEKKAKEAQKKAF